MKYKATLEELHSRIYVVAPKDGGLDKGLSKGRHLDHHQRHPEFQCGHDQSSSGKGIVSFSLGYARCKLRMNLSHPNVGAALISAIDPLRCSLSLGCPKSGVNHQKSSCLSVTLRM